MSTERTPGTYLYFRAAPGLLTSSQSPISFSKEGAGNATPRYRLTEDCVRVWNQEGLVLTEPLTLEELALRGSMLLVLGSSLLFCGILCFHCCVRPPAWGALLVLILALRILA